MIGIVVNEKDQAAVSLGQKRAAQMTLAERQKAGKKRMEGLTAAERRELASRAATARWGKKTSKKAAGVKKKVSSEER